MSADLTDATSAAAAVAEDARADEKGATEAAPPTGELHFNLLDGEAGALGKTSFDSFDTAYEEPPPLAGSSSNPVERELSVDERIVVAEIHGCIRKVFESLVTRVAGVYALIGECSARELADMPIESPSKLIEPVVIDKTFTFFALVSDLRRQETVYAARLLRATAMEAFLKARLAASEKK